MAQGRKLVWASLLAVGLWQFVLLGFLGPHGGTVTFWGTYIAPWLQRLAMTAPILVAGVVTGCLLRPRRPERLAALIGAAAALPIALPFAFAGLWSWLFMFVFGGGSRGVASLGLPEHYWSREIVLSTYRLFIMFWVVGLAAAVAGWVGARYWRAESWERFWRGPGGAIIRGALVTGAIGVVLEVVRWEVLLRPTALAMAEAQGLTRRALPLWRIGSFALSTAAFGSVVTALLVGWRPRWWWGAFAGSGIALALFSFALLNNAVERAVGEMGPVRLLDIVTVSAAVVRMVEGAVAGGYAGNWEDGSET